MYILQCHSNVDSFREEQLRRRRSPGRRTNMACASSIYNPHELSAVDWRLLVVQQMAPEDQRGSLSSSSASPIGVNSDNSTSGVGDDGEEVQSDCKGGPLGSLEALEEVLPVNFRCFSIFTPMDGLIDDVSLEEFKIFYGLDRELYTILVCDLSRNPSEALQIMGFWLWLERGGFSNLINTVLSLDQLLVNKAYDEALTCLNLVNNTNLSPEMISGIPITRRLLKKEVTLHYFQENRHKIFHGIQNLVSDVCIPALSDIMEQARRGGFAKSPARNKPPPVLVPVLPPAPVYRPPVLAITFDDLIARTFSGLSVNRGCDAGRARCGVEAPPRSARTMFVTFSKGYPVSEAEVRDFFTRLFGNCIESLYMQEVELDEQALYARIVFVKPSYIEFILNGQCKAKFSINGKHVWMRQFVPRSGRMWPCGCPTVGPSACPHQF